MGSERLFIGTSGWVYPHWRGRFYPRDLPPGRWFEFYNDAQANAVFNAMELRQMVEGLA